MRFFTFLLLISFSAQSQVLKGRITGADGKPLPKATLSLKSHQSGTVLRYGLSAEDGTYALPLTAGDSLLLSVSFAGYASRDSLFSYNGNGDLLFPSWQLRGNTLDAVVISSTKPLFEVQPDKTVFNVSQSITGAGGTALELLQKTPGVLVDKDDLISMNGKNGVRVYIDGRPSPLSIQEVAALLRSLPATDVEAIEIITNPSARYEAAGNAGIINIRLKKNKSLGTNGTVNAGWSVGIFPKYTGGVSLNHRNKKMNLYGSYNYNRNRNEGYLFLYRFQNDSIYDQRSFNTSWGNAHNARAGADFFLSKEKTIGVLLNINRSESRSLNTSATPILGEQDKQPQQVLTARSRGKRERTNLSANANYRFADTAGRVLSIDADYSFFDLDGSSIVPNVYTAPDGSFLYSTTFSNAVPVRIHFASLQAAVERKWKGGVLGAGFRSAIAQTDNRFSFFNWNGNNPELDLQRSNRFEYREAIHAAYLQWSKRRGKWSWQAGLRAEATSSLGELTAANTIADKVVKRNYLNLFPSGGFTYQLSQNHQAGLSFSRRIDRPSYQDLNPFENRIDELTYQKGNPFLRPQFTNTIELRHGYRYKLNSTLSFSDVQDFFAAITDTVEGRRNFITQRNIASQKVWSFNTGMPFNIAPWWSVYASAGLTHNRYRAVFEPGKEIRINNTVANIYQQHSFKISSKWSGEISSFYMSPYVWAGTYECRAIWNLDLGLGVKVLQGRGNVRASVTDIFRGMPWVGTSRLGALRIEAAGGWESRLFRLNFSYRFGSNEVKAARQRSTGLEDLNRRVQ